MVYKWNVNNWYLDIDFYLEVWGVIVFLEDWTSADFIKAVPSKSNYVSVLYSLSYKDQETFKFTFRQLRCNHIWYMFAVIKVTKTQYLI